ncbi:restriction endonuclease subunit S [Marinobacter xestospongiae]|uniref:Restriction endonuclease subunit S n=1 Tax=Marinobacter xestospongiae TaxID=994319 RepID=A0ABU3W1T2_9GAMM|nr:restriction endonuclease subunit S [Marinobacter xestospongiae]MDV2080371.1 restriction endonuclease subunit S [Marinobacter xestospongiae]
MSESPKQWLPLRSLATIHPGYPFRGKLPVEKDGNVFVVQFRHLAAGESLDDKDGKTLDRVTLPGRRRPDYLWPGDILFMARGTRNDAALVKALPHKTVCTPNFFHLRLNPQAFNLMPEFLAWQLNHVDAQRYFNMCSQGSAAPSVTKTQLGNLPVVVPPIDQQKLMMKIVGAAQREQALLEQLIENRQRMTDAVARQVLRPDTTTGK